jgi:hypothetical protein
MFLWGSFSKPSADSLAEIPERLRVATRNEPSLFIEDHELIKHVETCIRKVLPDIRDTSGPSPRRKTTYVNEWLWPVANRCNQAITAAGAADEVEDLLVGS